MTIKQLFNITKIGDIYEATCPIAGHKGRGTTESEAIITAIECGRSEVQDLRDILKGIFAEKENDYVR